MTNQFTWMYHEFPNDINTISVLTNSYLFFVFRLMMSVEVIINCLDIPEINLLMVNELGAL
jgi:hypothetical protein